VNPAAPGRNLHHTVAYRTEEEWWEDMVGKGPYDPDFIGYPYEIGPATHNYPLSSTLVDNESTSTGEPPF
jgi:hypothetical protein